MAADPLARPRPLVVPWAPEAVLDSSLSDRAVRLYLVLALYAGRGEPQPPARQLAKRLRCGVEELRAAMRELHRWPARPAWLH